MSLTSRIKNTLAAMRGREIRSEEDDWLIQELGALRTSSGERISPASAIEYPPVMACVRVLSEVESSLTAHIYRDMDDGGREKAKGHPAYRLLHDEPNPEMSAAVFRLYMRQNRCLWGNSYALPMWSNGVLTAIWPLRPDWMRVFRNTNGTKSYEYQPQFGPHAGRYLEGEIIHVRGLGDDMVGYSPIRLMRESIGLGKAAEKFGSAFFANGCKFGGILEVAGKMRDPEKTERDFQEKYAGAARAGRVLAIDSGSKFHATTIPPDDAQFLQTRSFQRTDIYGAFGVPPTLVGDPEKSTSWGSGIEQQSIGFVVYTVTPSLVLTEQEINRKVLGDRFFLKHNVGSLMRGDMTARQSFYGAMVDKGIMDRDEIRELEEMNRRGGGASKLTVQSQMIPLDDIGKETPQEGEQHGRAKI